MQIFSDKSVTVEDLMREKGNLVKKGSLSAEGDVEFWDDGSATPLPETVRISLLSLASSRAFTIGRRSGIGTPRLDAGGSCLRADWALSA